MKLKNLYCDIDNTVANQFARIKKYNKIKSVFFIVNNTKIILNDRVIKNSTKSIKFFSKKYNIHWLSARPSNLKEITKQWLLKKKFPISTLTLVNNHEAKLFFLKTKKVDLYIDDMKYNYFKLKPKLMTLFIKKINRLNINYEIFENNWEEIVKRYS
jgi:uncharacterized HAD superfamily protein